MIYFYQNMHETATRKNLMKIFKFQFCSIIKNKNLQMNGKIEKDLRIARAKNSALVAPKKVNIKSNIQTDIKLFLKNVSAILSSQT